VEAIQQGLSGTGVRIRTSKHVSLRVRWPFDPGKDLSVTIGQRVTARIAVADVLLGAAGVWSGHARWNRWVGRIVLVEAREAATTVTVKLRGADMTLKSTGPVLGLNRRPQTWDAVTVAVDPERIELACHRKDDGLRLFGRTQMGGGVVVEDRVWLGGVLQAVREVSAGWLLSLEIGDACVSALVNGEALDGIFQAWIPGEKLAVHVDQWNAWIRRCRTNTDPVLCRLVHSS
jgi:hypothetical protein